MKLKTKIQFANHASILISSNGIGLLTDPWYQGDAFHKGWSLLYENKNSEVVTLLKKTTHIWISHEHPDHFSISFFKKFGDIIKERNIHFLFQKTEDKRVVNFLKANGFNVSELLFNRTIYLEDKFSVTCIKDGFYDSGLLIEANSEKILNLNDCEVTTFPRAKEVKAITGDVDILLTQFSYAAWKGGKSNKTWRKRAAKEKLETIVLQTEVFRPKIVVPFASFIFFSNETNFYLNDAANKPADVIDALSHNNEVETIIMKPGDEIAGNTKTHDSGSAITFWNRKYNNLAKNTLLKYPSVPYHELQKDYAIYRERVLNNNNPILMKMVRYLSPIKIFYPICIEVQDLNMKILVNFFDDKLKIVSDSPHLKMHSGSLKFLFKNSFGFDTLTVNGCFEEAKSKGFVLAAKTLAIENLNNLGIRFTIATLFNFKIIKLFLTRLYRVARKLEE